MQEIFSAAGTLPQTSLGELTLQCPDLLAVGEGSGCPLPNNSTPISGLSGVRLQPPRPRC